MNDKFQNKYRIPSARFPNWDYKSDGAYFITICTEHRRHYFGEIVNQKMVLSPIGAIADVLWYEIKHRNKNVELGEFVVMPNHIHGIIILNNDNTVETLHATSLRGTDNQYSKISPKSNSISTIIRSYKSAVTKHARRLGYDFIWQTRFHDHIIRNEKSFKKISEYIINNPMAWEEDKFYKNEQ